MKPIAQQWSRRGILTLASGGLAGTAAVIAGVPPAAADAPSLPQVSIERAYRPLPLPFPAPARIQQTGGTGSGGAQVEAALDRQSIVQNQELVVAVRAAVASDLLGRRRVLRAFMIGDNGDLRMETVGPETKLTDPSFELEIALGQGDPIRDWNLISERIFAVRVSMDVLDSDDFAVSDDFFFKVRQR
jgi:hypothetical protein